MPYSSRKVRGKKCYSVYNTITKKRFSKCTSKTKASKQLNLLRALHYNKTFTPYTSKKRKLPRQSRSTATRKNGKKIK